MTAPPGNISAPLGGTTARGVGLLIAQSLVLRLVTISAQIAIGWFLDKQDFALWGLVIAIAAFTSLIQQAGLTEILVSRNKRFQRWESVAVWISLAIGALAAIVTVGAGALAAIVYRSPSLFTLLAVYAVGMPVTAAGLVPTAKLLHQLRFRALTGVGTFVGIATSVLTIVFAALGFHAYSFVLPRVIVPAAQTIILWGLARPRVRRKPQIRRWRFLARDSTTLLATAALGTVTMQADSLIIGAVARQDLGAYVFAFSLAVQSMTLLAGNLSSVLFPVLSKLNEEPRRQGAAFLRSAKLLAVIGMPICLLQGALIAPVLHLLFRSKWDAAIPIAQIGSVSVAIGLLNAPSISLLQARARFKTLLWLSAIAAVVFLAFVTPGAIIGGAIGATLGGMLVSTIVAFAYLSKALTVIGQPISRISSILLVPLAISFAAVGSGWATARFLPITIRHLEWVQVMVILCVSMIYLPLVRLFCPSSCVEIVNRAKQLVRRSVTVAEGTPKLGTPLEIEGETFSLPP